MPTETAAEVRASNLVASYRSMFRRHRVLSGLNLAARPGEITALVGPNGAGKTTFFSVLLGLLRPDQGRCMVGGMRPEEYRRRYGVGYLPQTSAFPRGWTARDVLARAVDLCMRAGGSAAFATAVERAGIDSALRASAPAVCSGGWDSRGRLPETRRWSYWTSPLPGLIRQRVPGCAVKCLRRASEMRPCSLPVMSWPRSNSSPIACSFWWVA